MTEHEVPSPAEAVRLRIETRRAACARPANDSPPVDSGAPAGVCDGWGVVPVLAMDGSGYEPAACLGCALCSEVRPPVRQRDPFARLPALFDEEEM